SIDIPGQPVNTLSPSTSGDFAAVMESIESDTRVRAAVIISRKPNNFIAGADIKVLDKVKSATDAEALSRSGHKAFQRMADARVPIVAAIHGSCLGGGLELALACHARVATDDEQTQLGLPEVQLGLIPGGGGTQRLPRLIGLQAALDMILTGKRVAARKARSLGLVDEVVPQPILEQVALGMALRLAQQREAGGTEARRGAFERMAASVKQAVSGINLGNDLQELVLEDNPLGRKVVFDTARKKLLARTHGNYPAPEKALEAMRVGMSKPEEGYAAEARFFGELVMSPQARQLMGIFLATTALKKDTGVSDAGVTPRPVHKVGVLGAGLMGAGIAYVTSALAGIPVRLKDRDPESVGRGLSSVRDILDGRVKRKRLSARRRDDLMAMVSPATDYSGFASAEVVIEAVFEDLALKQQMVRDVEAVGGKEVIFASNTSTIPIGRIAEASSHPETVIGMHYFSPVHKMPLLEIIVTDRTAPWVTATCVELGKRQGKTVIVVRDSVGFYTSRILGPYMNEAFHVLAEGVPVEAIDGALVDFGFPVGPIKLLDEVGIDVAEKAGRVVRQELGDRLDAPPGMEKLIEDQRLGRKNQRGFYLYGDKKKGVDQSVYALLGITPGTRMPAEDIARRCTLQMVNEAAHCFGEGVLRSARDGDIGAIFGLGFPPFLGGPFRYADSLGARALVGMLREHATRHGRRFEPAPVLVEMAEKNLRFYADGPEGSADQDQAQVMQPGRHPRRSGS
ncbi:MAG TPA: fatty acid oxidation complex subunit alpha FadJ, partial [Haliangium sp.]|nr:fatty acid oxidation complex subunit alpha FadJ [Haliangium sp.]